MVTAFVFFLLGGVMALLMRVQLAVSDNTFSARRSTTNCSRCTARR
jgi:heme/copper-type cytochrome/quinol oxidase subunit 1